MYNHLLIDDPYSAISEAKGHLASYPNSKALRLALIRALCEAGNEIEALEEWNEIVAEHNELLTDRASLEMLAWGVLNKGETSNQLIVRGNALMGAVMTRDARAIPLIIRALRGTNSLLRSVAVGMAAAYGDFPLQDEIARLLQEEKVWHVRLELIKAAGQLRMTGMKERLVEIIGNPQTLAEEKVAAIVSLVNMYDSVGDGELINLIKSNRAGLRQLACQIVSHLNLTEKIELLFPLLNDAHPDVRIAALNTIGLLGIPEVSGKPLMEIKEIAQLLSDHNPEVAITASWLALLRGDKRGGERLKQWIVKGAEREARLAAGALAVSGKQGVDLAIKFLKKKRDPYIQVTLALGLIGQRAATDLACKAIATHLKEPDLWMWDTTANPLFRSLGPSNVRHSSQIPNYPLVVDQLTRLELVQVLCIMEYPKAQESVKRFLQSQTWGAVGTAAGMLLQEGDDESLDLIRELLKDPDEKVRLQAALILALVGGDKSAIGVLKEIYPKVGRELKVHILEAIAKVGDPESIAFLLERLNEPFQVIRVIAATAIIKSLYH